MMASAGSEMIDQNDFAKINDEMQAYDEQREEVIKKSRDIGKLAKQAIFSLHRGAIEEAEGRLAGALKVAQALLPIIEREPTLRHGGFSFGLEEYVEGVAFKVYLQEGRLITREEVAPANNDEFLGGILDLTGELNQYAVARATARDKEAVQKARDLVDAPMGVFLQFDLRNGALRKKYDALKYCVKKLENTLYELSLTEAGGFAKKTEEEPEPAANGGGGGDEET